MVGIQVGGQNAQAQMFKDSHVVIEAYVHPFRVEDRHHIASCTKSFVSVLIGIALEQVYIDNLDQKLLNFFPDRTTANADARKEGITQQSYTF